MDQEAADIMAEQTAALQRIATALEKTHARMWWALYWLAMIFAASAS